MLFHSFEYFIFFVLVFTLFWSLNKNIRARNTLLLIVSYIFYGWWDYKILGLIFISTVVDFLIGGLIVKQESNKRKLLFLWTSIIFNIGLLFSFKYFNFFIESFVDLSEIIGFKANITSLNIILPVGISFYTFQTLSYSIDIYRGTLKPVNSFLNFATFVAFFPQLVAGPIERASNFLPQLEKKSIFTYEKGADGVMLILFGLFKKVVIADNLANYVAPIFDNPESFNGGELFLGAVYFAFQIYCDFSGYSDIAIGSAMLLGFTLMSNFNFPYFSQSLAEFWRRWHMSLNSWFNDYLYIPLGGSRNGNRKKIRNILIIFFVSGLWHGAGWNFVLWGGLTGVFFIIPLLQTDRQVKGLTGKTKGEIVFNIKTVPKMIWTSFLMIIAFAVFRSNSVENIGIFFNRLIFNFGIPNAQRGGILLVICIITLDYFFRKNERKVMRISKNKFIRYSFYYAIIISLLYCFTQNNESPQFIYFQF